MKHSDWNFRRLSLAEQAALYQDHMKQDFPDSELKPLSMLEELEERGINTIWGCFYQGALAGYYVLAREPGSKLILLDYLAVMPELRGNGCGSVIIKNLVEQLPEECYLFIESENPKGASSPQDRRIRERRVAFYQRCGAILSPLEVQLFGVDYAILTLSKGEPPSGKEQERAYRALYRQMLTEERCQQKVHTLLL